MKVVVGFVLLFLAYQAPEGIGQRLLGSFAWQSALLGLFFVVAVGVGRRRGRSPLDAYALDGVGRNWPVTVALFVAAVCAKLAAVAVGLQFGLYEGGDAMVTSIGGLSTALSVALPMTFLPSIAEDMVTRGYLFRARDGGRQRRAWGTWPFVGVSAAVYTLNHIFRLRFGPSEWLMLFVFGSVYAFALVRTGSLWPAVALHWGWNYANAAVDAVWAIGTEVPGWTRLLSSAAHVALFGVVWLLTKPDVRPASGG